MAIGKPLPFHKQENWQLPPDQPESAKPLHPGIASRRGIRRQDQPDERGLDHRDGPNVGVNHNSRFERLTSTKKPSRDAT